MQVKNISFPEIHRLMDFIEIHDFTISCLVSLRSALREKSVRKIPESGLRYFSSSGGFMVTDMISEMHSKPP